MAEEANGLPGHGTDEIWQNLANAMTAAGWTEQQLFGTDSNTDEIDAARWLRCAILPEDCRWTPLRYHDPANLLPTAAICIVDFMAINWQYQPNNSNGINTQMGPTDMAIFQFDAHPGCVLKVYNPNPQYRTWRYHWTFNGNPTCDWNDNGNLIANLAMTDTDGQVRGPLLLDG